MVDYQISGRVNMSSMPVWRSFLGSLASSFSTSVIQVIVFRAITGIGGWGLMTVAQIIVSDVVSLRDRGKYQGILVSQNDIYYFVNRVRADGRRERLWLSQIALVL